MAAGRRYASLGQRAIAVIIDGILFGILAMILFTVVLADAISSGNIGSALLLPAVFSVILLVAYILMEGLWGVTPGKKLIGIKVVDDRGNVPGIAKSLIRNILRIVDQLPTLYIIGIILIYTNDDNQRLGDMVGDTYVVRS
jgi:uncharacterized RDD family membrane protein YckC